MCDSARESAKVPQTADWLSRLFHGVRREGFRPEGKVESCISFTLCGASLLLFGLHARDVRRGGEATEKAG